MGHHWPWYAVTLVGAYRLTAAAFDATVRRVVRIASQARAESATSGRTSVIPSQPDISLPVFRPEPSQAGPLSAKEPTR